MPSKKDPSLFRFYLLQKSQQKVVTFCDLNIPLSCITKDVCTVIFMINGYISKGDYFNLKVFVHPPSQPHSHLN